jgi:putative flippase GtrA
MENVMRGVSQTFFVHFLHRLPGPDTLGAMAGLGRLRRRVPRTVVRFCSVGVANTVIDVVLFWVLAGPLGILVANFVSTSAGMTFSFLANGRHTFGASRLTLRQAVLFLATNGFTMWLLQPLLIATLHGYFTAPLILAKLVSLGGSVVANFLLYRFVVWPQNSPTTPPRSVLSSTASETAGV